MSRTRRLPHHRTITLVVIAAVLAIPGATLLSGDAVGSSPSLGSAALQNAAQVARVRQTFIAATTALATAMNTPAGGGRVSFQGAPRQATGSLESAISKLPVPSAVARSKQLSSAQRLLAVYFAPDQVASEMRPVAAIVSAEADPRFRNLGSGVTGIAISEVRVSGTSATVIAVVSSWTSEAILRQGAPGQPAKWYIDRPASTDPTTAHLVRQPDGHWLVTSYIVKHTV